MTGLQEIDGRNSEDAKEGEQAGRCHGAFEIISHIGDSFIRRFVSNTEELYNIQFRPLNQMEVLKKLNSKDAVSKQTHYQVLNYLSSIPVKSLADGTLPKELCPIVHQGFEFINNFYLEFEAKRDAQPAILNLLQLNYDNFLEVNDDKKIQVLTKEKARDVVNKEPYLSLMSENIRLLAVELLFI